MFLYHDIPPFVLTISVDPAPAHRHMSFETKLFPSIKVSTGEFQQFLGGARPRWFQCHSCHIKNLCLCRVSLGLVEQSYEKTFWDLMKRFSHIFKIDTYNSQPKFCHKISTMNWNADSLTIPTHYILSHHEKMRLSPTGRSGRLIRQNSLNNVEPDIIIFDQGPSEVCQELLKMWIFEISWEKN